MVAVVSVIFQTLWEESAPSDYVVSLWDDSSGDGHWRDLLVGASSLTVEWSVDAGLTWRAVTVAVDWLLDHPRAVMNVAKRFRDGTTEYLVRLTVDGTTYGPWTVRFY